MSSVHRVLGVAEGATAAQIRSAYRARVRAVHPDRFHAQGPEAVAAAAAAFRDLADPYRTLLAAATRPPEATVVVSNGVYQPRARAHRPAHGDLRFVGIGVDTRA